MTGSLRGAHDRSVTAIDDPATAIELLESRAEPLAGKVLGLIGYGAIGREIARLAAHRGMTVVYIDCEPGRGPHRRVQLGELLARSDFVMPVNGHAQLFRREELVALMKPGARLVELPQVAERARQRGDQRREGDQQE
jgi:phosphoglycerate dehydrogenase-like enzyme